MFIAGHGTSSASVRSWFERMPRVPPEPGAVHSLFIPFYRILGDLSTCETRTFTVKLICTDTSQIESIESFLNRLKRKRFVNKEDIASNKFGNLINQLIRLLQKFLSFFLNEMRKPMEKVLLSWSLWTDPMILLVAEFFVLSFRATYKLSNTNSLTLPRACRIVSIDPLKNLNGQISAIWIQRRKAASKNAFNFAISRSKV